MGHYESQYLDDTGTAVHEVTDEYGLSPLGMRNGKAISPGGVSAGLPSVSKAFQESGKFFETPVYIADDIERPVFVPQVDPQGHPLDGGCFHFLRRVEHEHIPEAFAFQPAQ